MPEKAVNFSIIFMKSVKFKTQANAQAEFAVALRKNVSEYFKTNNLSINGNWKMKVKSVAMLSIYIVPFILLITVPMSGWVALGMVVLIGVGKAGVGMGVMHDAVHGSYSSKKWVNQLMSTSMYLLGSNVFNWKVNHNGFHHTFTNIDGLDIDIASHGPIRLSDHAPVSKAHRYQHIYAFFLYGLLTLSKLVNDFVQLVAFNKSGITRQHRLNPTVEMVKLSVFKAAYLFTLIGLPLLVTSYTIWQVLAAFFLMHWVAGCILTVVFQLAHVVEGAGQPLQNSEGIIENDWVVHELETTFNFATHSKWLRWYTGGLNFQVEHHLFPHICHVHYPRIAPIVQQTAKEYGIAYNVLPTLGGAIASHVRRLKELGNSQ